MVPGGARDPRGHLADEDLADRARRPHGVRPRRARSRADRARPAPDAGGRGPAPGRSRRAARPGPRGAGVGDGRPVAAMRVDGRERGPDRGARPDRLGGPRRLSGPRRGARDHRDQGGSPGHRRAAAAGRLVRAGGLVGGPAAGLAAAEHLRRGRVPRHRRDRPPTSRASTAARRHVPGGCAGVRRVAPRPVGGVRRAPHPRRHGPRAAPRSRTGAVRLAGTSPRAPVRGLRRCCHRAPAPSGPSRDDDATHPMGRRRDASGQTRSRLRCQKGAWLGERGPRSLAG